MRLQNCQGYVSQVDCFSIESQDCIWFNIECEQRQYHRAPIYYVQTDCRLYGNCIWKLDGRCKLTPYFWSQILEEQFFEINSCIWLNGRFELLIKSILDYSLLKFPTYNNHKACQKVSPLCTFNLNSLEYVDYICENFYEVEYCSIDSSGIIFTLNQGQIDKKCNNAPQSYDLMKNVKNGYPNTQLKYKCTNIISND